jgi:hypothetical protein
MRGFLKSAYEMNIARDEAEKLTYFKVCLAGDALDTFLSWPVATRTSWALVCEKWKEAYPSKVVMCTFAENFNDWADAQVSEEELRYKTLDTEGRPVWCLIKFAQMLSELGSRLAGIDSVTKSHHVYKNLPLCVWETLPFDHSNMVSFEPC